MRTTAGEAPWQHGKLERVHRPLRRMRQATALGVEMHVGFGDVLEAVLHTRNDHVRVRGVSPYVLVFGSHPRRILAAGEGGAELETDTRVASLLEPDPGYTKEAALREAAGKAWLRHLTLEGLESLFV